MCCLCFHPVTAPLHYTVPSEVCLKSHINLLTKDTIPEANSSNQNFPPFLFLTSPLRAQLGLPQKKNSSLPLLYNFVLLVRLCQNSQWTVKRYDLSERHAVQKANIVFFEKAHYKTACHIKNVILLQAI